MKKITVVLGLCFVSAASFAQKLNTKDVPPSVKAGFAKNLSMKDAKWEKEGENCEASFKKDGKEMSAVFDAAGTLLETEVEIAKNELPAGVLDLLKKDYAAFKLEEAAKITAKGEVTYEAEIEKGKDSFELIFDARGK